MYVRISSYPFQNVRNTNIFLVCLPFRVHTDIRGCFMKYFGSNVIELRSIMPSLLGKTSVDNAEKWSSPLQTNPPPPPPGPPPVAQTYTQELPGHLKQWRTTEGAPLKVQWYKEESLFIVAQSAEVSGTTESMSSKASQIM